VNIRLEEREQHAPEVAFAFERGGHLVYSINDCEPPKASAAPLQRFSKHGVN